MSETNKDKSLQEVDFSDFKASNTEEEEEEEEEIEFDDNIDIDALQAKLQQHMESENINYTTTKASNNQNDIEIKELDGSNKLVPTDNNESMDLENFVQSINDNDNNIETQSKNDTPQKEEKLKLKLKLGEKKYVIYIEPDNIDFIEGLSVKERKKVINRILREEDETIRKKREIEERKKFTNQVIIMVLTVVFSLPVFFILLNKSVELTILNYQQAQQNFVKLYKEQGKIKSYKKFQMNFN